MLVFQTQVLRFLLLIYQSLGPGLRQATFVFDNTCARARDRGERAHACSISATCPHRHSGG